MPHISDNSAWRVFAPRAITLTWAFRIPILERRARARPRWRAPRTLMEAFVFSGCYEAVGEWPRSEQGGLRYALYLFYATHNKAISTHAFCRYTHFQNDRKSGVSSFAFAGMLINPIIRLHLYCDQFRLAV